MMKSKLLVFVAVLGLLAAFGPSSAFATCSTQTQNPDLTAMVCMKPNIVHVGGTITLSGSVTNNTTSTLTVAVKAVLKEPTGATQTLLNQTVTLTPGQSMPFSTTITTNSSYPLGKYVLVGSAHDSNGTSHAAAHTTLEP
jgi:hypothetical protein